MNTKISSPLKMTCLLSSSGSGCSGGGGVKSGCAQQKGITMRCTKTTISESQFKNVGGQQKSASRERTEVFSDAMANEFLILTL